MDTREEEEVVEELEEEIDKPNLVQLSLHALQGSIGLKTMRF